MKNYTKFEIKCCNQERFFNNLSKKIKIFDLKRDGIVSSFKVRFLDRKKVEKELKNNSIDVLSITSYGFLYQFVRGVSAYGLMSGVIIGLLFYFIQSCFIFRIEVWGNEKIASSEISSFVNKQISSRWKGNINTKIIENKVYNQFNELSFVSVAMVGQTLLINIKEEIIPEGMKGEYSPLTSQYDGVITNIKLIQGTLAVRVGDIIQAGQELVLPYIINAQGDRLAVEPRAEIIADVWLSGEECHSSAYYKTYRTGKTAISNEILFLKLKIYSKNNDCKYESYEKEQVKKNISKNNILPLTLVKTTYYETNTILVEEPFDMVQDKIIEQARQKALQKKLECDIIKEERKIVKTIGLITTVSYVITVERNLGE